MEERVRPVGRESERPGVTGEGEMGEGGETGERNRERERGGTEREGGLEERDAW